MSRGSALDAFRTGARLSGSLGECKSRVPERSTDGAAGRHYTAEGEKWVTLEAESRTQARQREVCGITLKAHPRTDTTGICPEYVCRLIPASLTSPARTTAGFTLGSLFSLALRLPGLSKYDFREGGRNVHLHGTSDAGSEGEI